MSVEESGPPKRSREGEVVRVRHFLTLGLWLLAIAVVSFWFVPLKILLLGVLAAGAMASALHPLMKWLPGPRVLRAVVIALVPPILLVAVAWGGGTLLASRVSAQVKQWPEAQAQIDRTLADWSKKFGVDQPPTAESVAGRLVTGLTGGEGGGGKLFASAANALSGALLAATFVFFGTLYLLAEDASQYVKPIRVLLPPPRRPQFDAALRDLIPRLRWWVIGTLISMSVVGVLSSVGYWLVGLRMAIPIGLLTGFSEVVPTLGPASSFVVAFLFGAAQGGGTVAGVVAVYAVVQVVESYILTPLVMQKAVDLPPLVTLFTIILWGQTLGAAGLLLAIPINLAIWSFVDHFLIRPRQLAVEAA